ncbi:DUF1318 domain-containing protein [Leptospira langatensis]|uniref:DUF1318 domain-containing protein n=1 Tax=Leptospira langatensis TaxID=2484983 RepID=A0A5F1ZY50_9LEPT|nr:DUF1318 domain-containing protein [Leptospira langatensis]TGK00027.1 DUF1318 domain-containing protein [Leptospira langatensis]TGL42662.1 DUF1318 domain-containing protein [Leptospira langatensis]
MSNILKYYIILSAFIFSSCVIKAPLITFTQTQTAAEKQMLGEDRNLEKDGWLIASIKTSSSGSEIWERDLVKEEFANPEDKTLYIALRTLAYLTKELREYRVLGVLSEGLDGKVRWNPKIKEAGAEKVRQDLPTKTRIENLLKLTNDSREIVIREKLKKAIAKSVTPLTEKEKSVLKESMVTTWIRSVVIGEYYESSPNVWKKKE